MYDLLKSHILHLMQKDGTPRRLGLLQEELGIGREHRPSFLGAVEALSKEGRVIVGPGDLIQLPSLSGEITGVFRGHARGYGFVEARQVQDEGDVFIPAKATGGAMTGDRVVARITRRDADTDGGRLTGRIVQVLERAHTSVVGVARNVEDRWVVHPDGGDFLRPIQIDGVDGRRVRDGDKVAVRIGTYPTGSQPARGVIQDVLGRPGLHDTEISAIIRRHGLCDVFDESCEVEAWRAKAAYDPGDTRGRQDLQEALVVTIDPPDAQDFDDAISLTRDGQGGWALGVHIADVSHFVVQGSALDRAALQRGNSVYLPSRTLPMLPELLSNEICSLQPGRPRYAKSVLLTYDGDGQVRSARFADTVIRSKARLTYTQVDQVLQGDGSGLFDPVVVLLRDMRTLARAIEHRRRQAGMLQLPMPETRVVMDESGQVVGVEPEDSSPPHTIVEMFMVEANVAVASLLDPYCIPFLRRVHPDPNPAALRQLSQTLRLLGVTLSRQPSRFDFQALLDQVRDTRLGLPVSMLVLRSLERAAYSPLSVGHYALAAPKYCHFTSPIRRYADLLVHRALQAYLTGQVDRARRAYAVSDLVEIGRHLSQTERAAEDAEREVKTILTCSLLHKRIGQELDGVVTSMTGHGAFVFLPDYGVEGLVRTEALGPDHWQYDEQVQCLVGRHSGAVLRMAQPLRVRIVDVYPAAGRIDLAPAAALPVRTPRRVRQGQAHGRRTSRRSGRRPG